MECNITVYIILGCFILLDVISGFSQAVYNKTVDSTIMRHGLWHKAAYVFAMALANLLEYGSTYLDLGFSIALVYPVAAFIVLTEAVSIFENILKLNPDLAESPLFDLFGNNRKRREDD